MSGENLAARLVANPFFVLNVATTATQREIDREGDKLLAMLALGLSDVATYVTPLGPQPRTVDLVRDAMNALRDPQKRLVHEWIAALLPVQPEAPPQMPTRVLDLRVFARDPLRRRP